MNKKYIVKLTDDDRQHLQALVDHGKTAIRKVKRAWILLKADAGPSGPAWPDDEIRQAYDVGLVTIHRVRQTWVEEGLDAVLIRRPKSRHRLRQLDGEQEAHLVALACSKPPAGRKRWTLRLLADRMIELGYCERVKPSSFSPAEKATLPVVNRTNEA